MGFREKTKERAWDGEKLLHCPDADDLVQVRAELVPSPPLEEAFQQAPGSLSYAVSKGVGEGSCSRRKRAAESAG